MTSETRKEFNDTFNAVATFTSLEIHSKINLNDKIIKFDKSFQKEDDDLDDGDTLSQIQNNQVEDQNYLYQPNQIMVQPL